MNAFTRSPVVSSGTATTAHFRIFGWRNSTASTSVGYTLKPETRIMSLMRSTMRKYPCSSMIATSPVCSHPSRITSPLSSGRFQ